MARRASRQSKRTRRSKKLSRSSRRRNRYRSSASSERPGTPPTPTPITPPNSARETLKTFRVFDKKDETFKLDLFRHFDDNEFVKFLNFVTQRGGEVETTVRPKEMTLTKASFQNMVREGICEYHEKDTLTLKDHYIYKLNMQQLEKGIGLSGFATLPGFDEELKEKLRIV